MIILEDWLPIYEAAVFRGAFRAAQALAIKTQSPSEISIGNDTPLEAFRRVLLTDTNYQIAFVRSTLPGKGCITNDIPELPLNARITCYKDNEFTEFTSVHELGHLFIDQTGNSFTDDFLDDPNLVVKDKHPAEPLVVLGYVQRLENNVWIPDWDRGNWGWGTGAEVLSNDPAIRSVGPCGSSSTNTPTAFQQNPCHVKDWKAVGDEKTTEIEETAADMFLNWVYWSLGLPDPISNYTGFENINWSGPTTGVEDLTRLAGDVRAEWMEQTINQLFSNQGW